MRAQPGALPGYARGGRCGLEQVVQVEGEDSGAEAGRRVRVTFRRKLLGSSWMPQIASYTRRRSVRVKGSGQKAAATVVYSADPVSGLASRALAGVHGLDQLLALAPNELTVLTLSQGEFQTDGLHNLAGRRGRQPSSAPSPPKTNTSPLTHPIVTTAKGQKEHLRNQP